MFLASWFPLRPARPMARGRPTMVVLGHSRWVQAVSLKYLIVLGYDDAFLKQLFFSIYSCQIIHVKSLISSRSFQFSNVKSLISIHSCQIIHFNSFMSIHSISFPHFNSLILIHSPQFLHFHFFISNDLFQFIHVNSFPSIHSCQVTHVESSHVFQVVHVISFVSVHSLQLIYFKSLISLHSFFIIHFRSFIESYFIRFISCQFTSCQPTKNSCKQTGSYAMSLFQNSRPGACKALPGIICARVCVCVCVWNV